MSFALSSIVRTRQKKTFFSLFILTLLLFYPSGSVLASEEENVDSFNVHPSTRWTETDAGFTTVVNEGVFEISDVGDGSIDTYYFDRELRDSDGIVETKFKFDVNTTGGSDDRFEYKIYSDIAGYDIFQVRGSYLTNNVYAKTELIYYDVNSGFETLELLTDERLFDNLWYVLRFDYDTLKSKFRFRCYFDNSSKVFDYSWYDLGTDRPNFFAGTVMSIRNYYKSRTSGLCINNSLEYVKAPFKEREWENQEAPVGFLSNGWFGCSAEDNIDDRSVWQLTVPYLDSISGRISGDCEDSTALAAGEVMDILFKIITVDYDDADLVVAVEIRLRMEEQIAPLTGFGVTCTVKMDGILVDNFPIRPIDDGDIPVVDFSFSLAEDRSRIIGNVIFTADSVNAPESYYDGIFSVDLSDVSADYSSEFVIRNFYDFDFDGDTEFYGSIRNVKIMERDIGTDLIMEWIGPMIPGMIEDIRGGDDFFVILFRWLGNLIVTAFEFVIDILIGALELALGLVELAIEALEPFLTAIQAAVAGLIDALVDAAGLLLDAIFDALVLAIDAVADVVFAFWDAIGLPDVLALFNELLAYIIELFAWTLTTWLEIVQLYADLSWIVLVVWWFWALPVQWARAGGNPLAGLGNFIEVFFYDAMPWSIFGFHLYIPQGIIFTLWMILLLPETFILFTALGL